MAEMADPRKIIDFYGTRQGVSLPGDSRLPAIRTTTAPVGVTERGFTMAPAGETVIDTTARRVPPAPTPQGTPLQIGYRAPRVAGAGIEGMGDFAPAAAQAAETTGPKIGAARLAARGIGNVARLAVSPPALVAQGLAIPARAQADATAYDNLILGVDTSNTVKGASGATYPRLFGASGTGLNPDQSIATGGSFKGGVPVMARSQVAPSPAISSAEAATPVASSYASQLSAFRASQEGPYADPRNTEAAFRASQEGPYMGGNVGYFSVGGAKSKLRDISNLPTGIAIDSSRNGVVKGQKENSADIISGMVERQNQAIAVEQELQKIQAARANPAAQTFKTGADFGGDGSNSPADLAAARQAVSFNNSLKLSLEQQKANSEASYRQGTLTNQQRELALKEAQAPIENDLKTSQAGYYRAHGAQLDKKASNEFELAKLEQQKELKLKELEARANSPLEKADATYAAQLAAEAGLTPSETMAGVKAGYRTAQKAKSRWFGPDQKQGLVDAQGRLYEPGAQVAPSGTQVPKKGGGFYTSDGKGGWY